AIAFPVPFLLARSHLGGHRTSQARVAFVVVSWKGLLDPSQAIRLELPYHADGVRYAPLYARSEHIHDQVHVLTDSFADLPDQPQIPFPVVAEDRIGSTTPPALHDKIALLDKAPEFVDRPVQIEHVEMDRGHRGNAVVKLGAKELAHGEAESFSLDIPKSHVDGTDRVGRDTLRPIPPELTQ